MPSEFFPFHDMIPRGKELPVHIRCFGLANTSHFLRTVNP